MRITSWNINGIRSIKTSLNEVLTSLKSDVICFQEVKASRSNIEEENAIIPNYNSYFSFPKYLSGYSGVATYCLDSARPFSAEEGLSGQTNNKDDGIGFSADVDDLTAAEILALECEGRCIITAHDISLSGLPKKLIIINVYCPRVDPEKPERSVFQINFFNLLQKRAEKLCINGFHVLIVGDINCSHKQIDHCDPTAIEDFEERPSRKWLTSFLDENKNGPKFVDTFRYLYPTTKEAFTCWNTKMGCRKTNYGTRLDYLLCDIELLPYVEDSLILSDIEGSDHCPVMVILKNCEPIASSKNPSICSKNWPEFAGKQQSLATFLTQNGKNTEPIKSTQTGVKRKYNAEKTLITNFFTKKNSQLKKDQLTELTSSQSSSQSSQLTDSTSSPSSSQSSQSDIDTEKTQSKQSIAWKGLLKGPPKPPKCKIHSETTLLRTVKKPGPNLGKQFFVCPRPQGASGNLEARCDFFQWVK